MSGSRTALFARHQSGGLFTVQDQSQTTGDIYFVSSLTGTDAVGYGQNPDAPFASIAFALTQVTATQGDRIYVMPGHVEVITKAAGCNIAAANVAVIGLGDGDARPQITYSTAATASFDINAAGARLENMWFVGTGFAAITALVNVKGAGAVIRNCFFQHANSTNQAVQAILTTAAGTRLRVDSCTFWGSNNAGTTAAITIVGGDRILITSNIFQGAYSSAVGAIQNITTTCTNTVIEENFIQNFTASCTKAITMLSGSTGQIGWNNMQILSGTAPITGAAMSWIGSNYYAAAVGEAGTLI